MRSLESLARNTPTIIALVVALVAGCGKQVFFYSNPRKVVEVPPKPVPEYPDAPVVGRMDNGEPIVCVIREGEVKCWKTVPAEPSDEDLRRCDEMLKDQPVQLPIPVG
jgi:hypothetical protein